MMETKQCRFCGKSLPNNIHGNRRYCNNVSCYKKASYKRGHNRYMNERMQLQQIKQSENTLRICYHLYGNEFVPASTLDTLGFNWTYHNDSIEKEGNIAKVVGSYAFQLYKNKTVRIWKI